MTRTARRRLRSLATLMAFLAAGQAVANEAERLERFNEQTVMITVTHRDQSVTHGAGVVLCQEFGRAYVLTAYQLLAGEAPRSGQVLRRPARTEIRFFDDRLPSFVDERTAPAPPDVAGPRRGVTLYKRGDLHGPSETFYDDDPDLRDNPIGNDTVSSLRVDPGCQVVLFEHIDYQGRSTTLDYERTRLWGTEVGRDEASSLKVSCHGVDEEGLTIHQVPEDGLALLSFPSPPLRWTAATRRGIVESWDGYSIFRSKQPAVSAVGYRNSAMETWAHQSGRLLPGGGRLLHHSAPIDQGFIGGPLFNKKSLIGINLRQVPGEEIGAAAGEVYGEALSVKQILPAIGKWLPERCQFWIGGRVGQFLPPATDSAPPPSVAEAVPQFMADMGLETLYEHPPLEGGASFSRSFQQALSEKQWLTSRSADPERLEEQTVMITVTGDDGGVEHGAGVVLCRENRQAYVLTAHHVLAGKQPAGDDVVVRHSGRTQIQFFGQSVPSVVDDPQNGEAVITVHDLPEADLTLLTIPVFGHPESRPSLVRPAAWAWAADRDPPDVLALGYRKSPAATWAMERGTLLEGDGERLLHSAAIVEGFSGGPLFHASGALLGINLERIAAETSGTEADVFHGEALPIEQILPRIRQWLPGSCLRAMENAIAGSVATIDATAFLARADEMRRVDSRRESRFGPYRIASVHGGAVRRVFSRTRATQKYKFSIDDSDGSVWQGECTTKITNEEEGSKFLNFMLDQVLDESLVVAINSSLSCTLDQQAEEKSVELVLEERDQFTDIEGTGTVGGVQIEVAGTGAATNYLLHDGRRILGAVVKTEGDSLSLAGEGESETVWLEPTVTGELRSVCAAAAAALLLHPRFE